MKTDCFNRLPSIAGFLLWALSFQSAQAALKWESQEVAVSGTFGQEKVQATFRCTNTGNAPTKIGVIKTSCGCTVAEIKNNLIKPNETGQVDVYIDTKRVSGSQQKFLLVPTDESEVTVYKLSVKIELPNPIVRQADKLEWFEGEDLVEKSFEVWLDKDSEVNFLSVSSDNQSIDCSPAVSAGQKIWTAKVKPRKRSLANARPFTVEMTNSTGGHQIYRLSTVVEVH